jgi:RNA polymerase sigma factor (TIGR02999 family)
MRQEADLTGLLQAWSRGDQDALARLVPLVQRELREMARRMLAGEPRADGWQPTDLLHESYVRLLEWRAVRWQSRSHFFAATARLMRHVLVDAARARRADKRGGGLDVGSLGNEEPPAPPARLDLVALADALDVLAETSPRTAQVVELRFFGGFSVEETAETIGVSPRTVVNEWNTARAWLYRELSEASSDARPLAVEST